MKNSMYSIFLRTSISNYLVIHYCNTNNILKMHSHQVTKSTNYTYHAVLTSHKFLSLKQHFRGSVRNNIAVQTNKLHCYNNKTVNINHPTIIPCISQLVIEYFLQPQAACKTSPVSLHSNNNNRKLTLTA